MGPCLAEQGCPRSAVSPGDRRDSRAVASAYRRLAGVPGQARGAARRTARAQVAHCAASTVHAGPHSGTYGSSPAGESDLDIDANVSRCSPAPCSGTGVEQDRPVFRAPLRFSPLDRDSLVFLDGRQRVLVCRLRCRGVPAQGRRVALWRGREVVFERARTSDRLGFSLTATFLGDVHERRYEFSEYPHGSDPWQVTARGMHPRSRPGKRIGDYCQADSITAAAGVEPPRRR